MIKNNIVLILFYSFGLIGCASSPTSVELTNENQIESQKSSPTKTTRLQNEKCVQVGNYARMTTILKEMGVKQNELDYYSNVPITVSFPFKVLRREVYEMEWETPAHAFVYFYDICDLNGYENLMTSLIENEKARRKAKK